jgi:mannose/fructose/N-acetylgalactosamine-specific phosphotransferase system component IID
MAFIFGLMVVDGIVEKCVLVRMTVSLSAGQSQGLRGRKALLYLLVCFIENVCLVLVVLPVYDT